MNSQDSIIEKIRKLQALADRAGTEAEAALAAEKVAELCQQHNLDIGVARLAQLETEATDSLYSHGNQQFQAHWWYLAQAVATLFNVGYYRWSEYRVLKNPLGVAIGQQRYVTMHFYGLKANVEAALLTYEYLLASIESLLDGYMKERRCSVSDRRSFRLGASERIWHECQKHAQAAQPTIQAGSESMALVLLSDRLVKAHAAKLRLRQYGFSGASNHDHYSAGYDAGGRVDLHGARRSRMLCGS